MTDSYQYVESTGLIVANTSTILSTVQSEWRGVFGTDLVVTPDTPQGVMITAEALARTNVMNNNAAMANQVNPNLAGGVFLDAILALTGVQRTAQTPTTVPNVTVTGVATTIIPQGAQVQTAAGDIFETTAAVTIPSGGTTTVNFQSVAYGAIPCAIGAFTVGSGGNILTAVVGWETVNNTNAATVGTVTQSDVSARAFRQDTMAFQALGLPAAITSALYNVSGVQSVFFQENTSNSTVTMNSIVMAPHSVYACVQGGSQTAIAAALLENKGSGAAWNGSTSVSVTEPASGQTYTVQYDVPTTVNVAINVTVHGATIAASQQAILDFMAGNISGLSAWTVGYDISPFEIAAAIMSENPGAYISSVTVGVVGFGLSTTPVNINVNQVAFTQASYINVTVN